SQNAVRKTALTGCGAWVGQIERGQLRMYGSPAPYVRLRRLLAPRCVTHGPEAKSMSPAGMRSAPLSIVPPLPVDSVHDAESTDIQAIYRSIVEYSRDGFVVVDDHGAIVFANPAAAT